MSAIGLVQFNLLQSALFLRPTRPRRAVLGAGVGKGAPQGPADCKKARPKWGRGGAGAIAGAPAPIGKSLIESKKRLIEAGFWPGPRAEQVRSFLLQFWSSDPSVILRLSFGFS